MLIYSLIMGVLIETKDCLTLAGTVNIKIGYLTVTRGFDSLLFYFFVGFH